MCSWCWGFAPTVAEVEERLAPDVVLSSVMGGLAPDSSDPMPEATRRYVRSAWDAVERATGARFNREFWSANVPRRSTYPACRAVLAAERLAPGAGRPMFRAIQEAYYLRALNPSDASTLVSLANELAQGPGPAAEPARFAEELEAPATHAALRADLERRDRLGVSGFPSLALEAEGSGRVLVHGWQPREEVLGLLEGEGLLAP
jgi:putative protein-disulfide isomerase